MSDYYKDKHRYDDILDMPHHQSTVRVPMSLHDRAAQFAPFAALTGYEEELEETARITQEQIKLTDTAVEGINEKLFYLSQHLSEKQMYAITYFKQDRRKQGGSYLTDIGIIKKLEQLERLVIMENGIKIPMEKIIDISETIE